LIVGLKQIGSRCNSLLITEVNSDIFGELVSHGIMHLEGS